MEDLFKNKFGKLDKDGLIYHARNLKDGVPFSDPSL